LNREDSEPFQPVQELGSVMLELPYQRRSLVFQQIAALGDEDSSATAVEQLTAGGDEGLHGNSRIV
jgi:hypothetical protein